jgi:hypothetical protein
VPDPYRKLTAAVVEIGTQLRRIADHQTTPVYEDADDAQTTAILDLKETIRAQRDEASALAQQREHLRDTLHEVLCTFAVGAAYGERPTYTLVSPVSKETYERWAAVIDQPSSPATPVEHLAAKYKDELEQARKDADICSRAARSAMEQRQEMAEERYALQEQRDQLDTAVDRVRKQLDETRAALRRTEGDRDAAEERRDELAATLHDVLSSFVHKGHPGKPCLQSGWIAEKTVAKWRAVLYLPANEEQPGPAEQPKKRPTPFECEPGNRCNNCAVCWS